MPDLQPAPQIAIEPERASDSAEADAIVARAFGPGRYAKSSERVREFATWLPELSFCAWLDGRLIGVVRLWRVRVGEAPVAFLGPLAVETGLRGAGYGLALLERACAAAEAAGYAAVVLVGDEPYYARVGFSAAAGAGIVMPGPVDRRRVLARPLGGAAAPLAGSVASA
ncbi:MAG: N-acetyltransferase [Phenylobacterium sp.]